jgi:hypothetical protein
LASSRPSTSIFQPTFDDTLLNEPNFQPTSDESLLNERFESGNVQSKSRSTVNRILTATQSGMQNSSENSENLSNSPKEALFNVSF